MSRVRPAGFNERRCIARDVLGLYGSIVTLGTYSTAFRTDDSLKEAIFKAVKYCISQHAVLRTIIQDADTEQPQLDAVPEVDLTTHVRWESLVTEAVDSTNSSLGSILERVHNESWHDSYNKPLWRLSIIRLPGDDTHFHAAFATSHALADGKSGLAFHATLLHALRSADFLLYNASPVAKLTADEASPLLPPLDRAAHLPISWSFLLGPLIEAFLPERIARMLGAKASVEQVWHGAAQRPQVPAAGHLLSTAVHVATVPAATVRRALVACKPHGARLTGLLNILAARALAATLRLRGKDYSRFVVETAIDMRRCLSIGDGCMANYTSATEDTLDVDVSSSQLPQLLSPASDQDWLAARGMTEKLAAASSTLADHAVTLLKYLSNYREWTAGKASSPAAASFSTSNLGAVEDAAAGAHAAPWAVKQMLFSQSADATGAPFNVNVASCKDGPLVLVLSWWPGMLGVDNERLFMAGLADFILQQLEAL